MFPLLRLVKDGEIIRILKNTVCCNGWLIHGWLDWKTGERFLGFWKDLAH